MIKKILAFVIFFVATVALTLFVTDCLASVKQDLPETTILAQDEFWGEGWMEIRTISGQNRVFLNFCGDEIEKLEVLSPPKGWLTPKNRAILNGATVIFTIRTEEIGGEIKDLLIIRSRDTGIDQILNPTPRK